MRRVAGFEQRFFAVVELEGQVHNGGFDQYSFNDTGNRAAFAREGLVLFEEPEADGGRPGLRLVDCAFEAFPNHRRSANPYARDEQLARWGAAKARLFSRADTVFDATRINYSAVRRCGLTRNSFPHSGTRCRNRPTAARRARWRFGFFAGAGAGAGAGGDSTGWLTTAAVLARGGYVNPWQFIADPRASAYLTAVSLHGYRSGWLEYARTHPLR